MPMKQKTYVDDTTWYYKQEDFEQKEFMRDVEATAMFGRRFKSASLTGPNSTRGLWEYAELFSKQIGFSSAIGIQEADLSLSDSATVA